MKTKTLLATLALTLAPGLALAYECNSSKMKQTTASTCAAGQVMDPTLHVCVPAQSS